MHGHLALIMTSSINAAKQQLLDINVQPQKTVYPLVCLNVHGARKRWNNIRRTILVRSTVDSSLPR